MLHNLQQGDTVRFAGERLPYTVMATSDRYAVVSRKLNRREDAGLLHHRVEMNAYSTFTEAYNAHKNDPVYSLLDFQEGLRAPSDSVFDSHDYSDAGDCQVAVQLLESGKVCLSRRNQTEIILTNA